MTYTHNGTSTYSNLQTPIGMTPPAGSFDCPDASGSTTAYTCPISNPQATQYATGMLVAFKPQTTNTTTTPTLNVAALGVKNLVAATGGAASITVGQLIGGTTYLLEYDGASLRLLTAGATATTTIASGAKTLATGAIGSATCTAAQTDTATGAATTDAIVLSFNADPTGVTGYAP